MNLIGAFVLGGATVIACYELAWWLADRHVRIRVKPKRTRIDTTPGSRLDAMRTLLEKAS